MKKIIKRIVYFLLLALSVNALASIGNTMSVGQERMRPGVAEPDTVKPRFAVRRTVPENEADLDKKTMDLRTPDNLKTDTVYDPATGHYTIGTKLGDSYLNAPILMTPLMDGVRMLIVVSMSAVAAISRFSSPLKDFSSGITVSMAGIISITFSAVMSEKFRLNPVFRSFFVRVA